MKEEKLTLSDESATESLASAIATVAKPGHTLYISGNLGAGKTTFVRAFLRALGVAGAIKSPSYAIVEPYQLDICDAFHFDLYRINDPEELEFIGWRDYFNSDAIILVEWPEKAQDILPKPSLSIALSVQDQGRIARIVSDVLEPDLSVWHS